MSKLNCGESSLIVRLTELVRCASNESDPRRALERLLGDCVKETRASSGRLYVLDLTESAYILHDPQRGSDREPCKISLLQHAESSNLRWVIDNREPSVFSHLTAETQPRCRGDLPQAKSRLIVPIVQENTCLGVLDLDSIDEDHFTATHKDFVCLAAATALLLLEKEDTLKLLRELQRPIPFNQSEDAFLDDLMLLIAASSRMPIFTLRELDGDQLLCRRSYGLVGMEDEDMHLSPISEYPMFEEAVQRKRVVVKQDMSDPVVLRLLETLNQTGQNIKSICVVPVVISKEQVFGTLSFALKCPHVYTQLQRDGLMMIANAVGVSLTNFDSMREISTQRFDQARVNVAVTTMEISQAVRHEALVLLGTAQNTVGNLKQLVAGAKRTDQNLVEEKFAKIEDHLDRLFFALQKIKTATKPPVWEYRPCSLAALWNSAFELVTGRLDDGRISFHVQGDAVVNVAPEFLQTAFVNIISNSIDAFRDTKKQGRRIDVKIASDERAKDITIRYADNGPGIDPSKLGPVLEDGKPLAPEAIFQSGVTSKKEGSGYGMFLVRKTFTDHKGSIDLEAYRNGAVFKMHLPKDNNRA